MDTDILIKHAPPRAHLDLGHLGCSFLLEELWRRRPCLHVCGHVHEGYGQEWIQDDALQRAYEKTAIEGGGLFNLLRVCVGFVHAYLRPPKEYWTLTVNSAMVGGLRGTQYQRTITVLI